MENTPEILPQLTAYQPALLALAVLLLSVLVQSMLTAPLAFIKGEQAPGSPLQGGHDLFSFRVLRAYLNSVENLPGFGLALGLAIALGLDASTVNWLAGAHVAFRLLFWFVYYSGIGKVAGGPRTLSYVGALTANMILAGYVLYGLLQ